MKLVIFGKSVLKYQNKIDAVKTKNNTENIKIIYTLMKYCKCINYIVGCRIYVFIHRVKEVLSTTKRYICQQ